MADVKLYIPAEFSCVDGNCIQGKLDPFIPEGADIGVDGPKARGGGEGFGVEEVFAGADIVVDGTASTVSLPTKEMDNTFFPVWPWMMKWPLASVLVPLPALSSETVAPASG